MGVVWRKLIMLKYMKEDFKKQLYFVLGQERWKGQHCGGCQHPPINQYILSLSNVRANLGEIDYGKLMVVWKSGHAGTARAGFGKEMYSREVLQKWRVNAEKKKGFKYIFKTQRIQVLESICFQTNRIGHSSTSDRDGITETRLYSYHRQLGK